MPTRQDTTPRPTIHARAILSIAIPRNGTSETIEYADGSFLGEPVSHFNSRMRIDWVDNEEDIPLPNNVDWESPQNRGIDYVKYVIKYVSEAIFNGTHDIVNNDGNVVYRQNGAVITTATSRREAKAIHHHVCKRCKASSCCASILCRDASIKRLCTVCTIKYAVKKKEVPKKKSDFYFNGWNTLGATLGNTGRAFVAPAVHNAAPQYIAADYNAFETLAAVAGAIRYEEGNTVIPQTHQGNTETHADGNETVTAARPGGDGDIRDDWGDIHNWIENNTLA